MSDPERVQMLKQILEQNPNERLARYALAMEYAGGGDTGNALEEFARLRQVDPDYVNAYFMAAQTLARAGRTDEARQMLHDGIACAQRIGNQHARSEMEGMLEEIGA